LFQRVEDTLIDQEIEKLKNLSSKAMEKKDPPYAPLKEAISIDDFVRADLRVGLILKAEKVAKSKKLLKLEVDIGLETRTVLSGISAHYLPEALVGKKVIVVANLKPATIMGIESNGMILAGAIDSHLELAAVQDLPAGAVVS
jgi:methionyl-tRNA synthetase